MKWNTLIITLVCGLTWSIGVSVSPADQGIDTTSPRPVNERVHARDATNLLATGTHWRLETRRGVVHVWTPENYDPTTAGLVVYVHGYRSDADQAWNEHGLVEQFAASGVNALFIVPQSPRNKRQRVRFQDLGELLGEVRALTGLDHPWGRVVAIGHSGAYRTLSAWLEYPDLKHVILLDGLYNHQERFQSWLLDTPHRMTLVTMDTLRESEQFVRAFPNSQILDWVPEAVADLSAEARQARFLYIRSQFDHMGMITEARVIPLVLERAFQEMLPVSNATSRAQGER